MDENSEKRFLKGLIDLNDPNAEDCNPSDLILDTWESGKEANFSSPFVFDSDPTIQSDSHESGQDVPMYYTSKFGTVLEELDQEKLDKKKESRSHCRSCFNCLGDHNMTECPEPRNQNAIMKNRREYMNKASTNTSKRYHLVEEQIYSHLKPGQMSKELRKALNLKKNQLPPYVYMMRRLGYPPAWLEEAKVFNSGLAMFDSHVPSVSSYDAEDSEMTFDVEQILDIPGFNVAPGPKTEDESMFYDCPPMMPCQSKKEMIKYLNSLNKASRKRVKKNKKKEVIEIDLEEPIAASKSNNSEPIMTVNLEETSDRSSSPSLADLETQKQRLMKELENGCKPIRDSCPPTPESLANVGQVKHVDLGTPILQSASPYSRIPHADNFSQGICDVINFENLPGTTGHFSRLNKILHKMRDSTGNSNDSEV